MEFIIRQQLTVGVSKLDVISILQQTQWNAKAGAVISRGNWYLRNKMITNKQTMDSSEAVSILSYLFAFATWRGGNYLHGS